MKTLTVADTRGLRQFGLTLAIMLPLVFWLALPWLFGHSRPAWPFYLSVPLLAMAWLWPRGLFPVYRAWMALARVLGAITNTIVLGLVFCLIMIPLGFVLRRMGKLQYREGFDADAETYRVTERRRPGADDLRNPF